MTIHVANYFEDISAKYLYDSKKNKILLYLLNVSDFFESVLLKVPITGLEDNWREAVRISISSFTSNTETHPADWSLELGDKSR